MSDNQLRRDLFPNQVTLTEHQLLNEIRRAYVENAVLQARMQNMMQQIEVRSRQQNQASQDFAALEYEKNRKERIIQDFGLHLASLNMAMRTSREAAAVLSRNRDIANALNKLVEIAASAR